jgi:glycerol kinase
VGITNQGGTTVLWDRNGLPRYNALVWQDTRTARHVAEMSRDGGPDRFRAATGLSLAPLFSAQLLRWLLHTVPGALSEAQAAELMFGTIDSWLVWNLTVQHITDVTNASKTQLMNLDTLDWDPALLEAFGIPLAVLPRIVAGTARGVLQGVPVAAILHDVSAALVGQACFEPGDAKNTYGTAVVLAMNTGTHPVLSTAGLMTTVAYKFGEAPACYALVGLFAVAGSLVQWLRDNLNLIRTSAEIEALAATVPDNGDVYFVPAFSGLMARAWEPQQARRRELHPPLRRDPGRRCVSPCPT